MRETIRHYYNEHDAKAAGWLRELIKRGFDERSIADVQPDDLRGYRQCHFFAGIGGWSRALQLAGWSPARSVWTGSCPCQPFSVAGRGKGASDERHLWLGNTKCGEHERRRGLGDMGCPADQATVSNPATCWDEFQLVQCRDGKARRVPIESAFFPLADGIPARVVRLRGYGNAIVPQVAAEFIGAFLEWEHATGEGEA